MNDIIWYEIDKDFWCETRYITGILNILEPQIDNYSIIITPNLTILPKTDKPKIVILTGDELGRLGMHPYQGQNVKFVFRIYNDTTRFDNKFIFPIPCGYNWTMHSDRTKKMVKMYSDKKLSERSLDIFYSGQNISWRQGMVNNLNKMSNSFKISSNVYNGFRTGIFIDDYYKLLGETKISLAPDGTAVGDTFRFNESFGSGCIVITTKTYKNNLWYYENSPAIFINSWNELNEDLIHSILSKNIDELYYQNLEYYKNYLSEEAVAEYMLRIINVQ